MYRRHTDELKSVIRSVLRKASLVVSVYTDDSGSNIKRPPLSVTCLTSIFHRYDISLNFVSFHQSLTTPIKRHSDLLGPSGATFPLGTLELPPFSTGPSIDVHSQKTRPPCRSCYSDSTLTCKDHTSSLSVFRKYRPSPTQSLVHILDSRLSLVLRLRTSRVPSL